MKNKDRLKSFFNYNIKKLEEFYPGVNFDIFYRLFLESGKSDDEEFVQNWCDKSLIGVPFSYILNKTHFYGYDYEIEEGLFIPRYETEMLVEIVLEWLKNLKNAVVYDVCVGPGTISVPLLIESKADLKLTGIDINPKAIEYAYKNAEKYSDKINEERMEYSFNIGDRLYGITDKADMIVTNPPYIKKEADKFSVHQQVQDYEPDIALYLDDEIYDEWFERFFSDSLKTLKSEGCLFMEGHENHLQSLSDLAKSIGFTKTLIIDDLTGRNRFLKAIK